MEPIPLALVRAGRDLTEPRVSPDGRWVAFVARTGASTSINRIDARGDGVERQWTFGPAPAPGRGLGGGCYTWLMRRSDEASIVYVSTDGDLWRQDGPDLERLTVHERTVRAPTVAASDIHRLVVYAVGEAEVWLLDLHSGTHRRLDDARHEFCFDPAISPDERFVSWQAWSPPDMPWDGSVRVDIDLETGSIREWRPDDASVQQPRFTPSGERVHVHDDSGWLNVHVEHRCIVSEPVEHAGPTWGMGNRSYAFDDTGARLAFTRNEHGHGALCVVDLTTGVVEQWGRGVHGHLTWAHDSLVAIRSGARAPTQIVRYDSSNGDRTTLAHSQPDVWPTDSLPEPEMVKAVASDGSVVRARRFVADTGRLLVWIHGGPTDQWQVDWRPRITYWWSRGWDVLVVDPRGTTGHGRLHQQALHGQWGRLDVDDTATLVAHVHASGWAEPSTTVVIGGSSGGLTVLGILADHPSLVAAGVTASPVSDLRALTEATHRFEAHYTDTLVAPNDGSAESDAAFARLSPINRADRITSPLLIFHGTDDPVVPISQSEALVERIAGAGGDVEFVVFEGEGHGFRDPAHVTHEYERTEAFLDRVTAER